MSGIEDPIVVIDRLSKTYGEVVALDGLSLRVSPGTVFALLGPNGAGKTTAIKLLIGMLAPSSGGATIGGFDCFCDRAHTMTMVGYQPDEPTFQDHLSGWDLIRFAGDMRGMAPARTFEKAGALAERLNLSGVLDEYAANYSKGMRKKLAAVLALMHEPRVLILDEPTNGLDPYATRDMHDIIRRRAEAGAAVFFSTHLLDQAQRTCDRVGIIHHGRLVEEGPLDRLGGDGGSLEELFFRVTGTGQTDGEPPSAGAAPGEGQV